YLRIHELRDLFDAPCLALTATASPQVMEEITKLLALRDPQVVAGEFNRPNLCFAVRQPGQQGQRLDALEEELVAAKLGRRGKGGRGIVYCSTRKTAEAVSKSMRARGFAITHYHAGRTKLARERAQKAFELGRTPLLAATNAFGMGIDLPDIRLIVHFQAPGSLEAYYQEAGRAGRDGAPARCVLFFGAGDLNTQRRLASASAGSAKLRAHRERSLEGVARYAQAIRCRQQMLCAHFSGGKEHPTCGGCDVCVDAEGVEASQTCESERSADIQLLSDASRDLIVDAVERLRRPVGRGNLARALRGSRAKSLSRGGLMTLPEYGKLADYDEASVVAAVDALLAEGRLERRGRKYPTVWIPGKAIRTKTTLAAKAGEAPRTRNRAHSRGGSLARALDNYRKRTARRLKWKTYMVFQKRVILAIDREEPASHDALARIPGLGPAKIERFGDDILQLVREHGRG
ncbi:MAG: helicase-related protein, partial [Myxococcota bacterium]